MLHIVGRRDDGYHLLQTVFQFVDLCDQMEFNLTLDGSIRRTDSRTPVAEHEDLAIKAAQLLQGRYRV